MRKSNQILEPGVTEHLLYTVRIYRRENGKWFSTIAKDAIRVFVSEDVSTKPEAIGLAAKNLV